MFHSARLQLTAWYLLIIMVISLLFSGAIYTRINTEFVRFEKISKQMSERQRVVIRMLPSNAPPQIRFDSTEIHEARMRLLFSLGFINAAIFIFSGAAGYFLAGKTLMPIQNMVTDQKRFITDASHELRTPLTSLRTEIEVSLRDRQLRLSDAKKLLKSNLEEVIHLQSLADGLLALAVEQKSKRLYFSELSLREVLMNAKKKVQPQAAVKKISFTFPKFDVEIRGDSASLTELFIILFDNAIKYSYEKGTVSVSLKKTKRMAVIMVKDNGIGISKKDLPYIFDRFYRADAARDRAQTSGYGLGLTIARRIVEEHNGKIAVVSNHGTTFTVSLPLP